MITVFEEPHLATHTAGEGLKHRLESFTDEDVGRTDIGVHPSHPGADYVFDQPYTLTSHRVILDDKYWHYSFLFFPTRKEEHVIENFDVWPGEMTDYEDEEKLETITHTIANGAIDKYAECSDYEFDVSPPQVEHIEPDNYPFSTPYSDDQVLLTALFNEVTAGATVFRHLFFGKRGRLPHPDENEFTLTPDELP